MSAENLGYLRDLLFATQSPAGAAVNLIIFSLFFAGLVDVAASYRRLRREKGILLRARKRLSMASEGSLGTGVALLARLEVPPKSLVGRRIERLLQIRKSGLRHSEVLRGLSGDRLAGYGALARFIGAILTLLGLLGTVLGLSYALFHIQGALGNAGAPSAIAELTVALRQTLVGMRTAFACTLAGLSTALLLSACNHAVSRLLGKVAADLEEMLTCELLPALERIDPGADEAAQLFARLLVDAGQNLAGLREQVTLAAAGYGEASQQMATSVQALGTHVDAFGRHLAEISTGQREVAAAARDTAEALRTNQEAYESSLQRHSQELQALAAQNREILTSLATAQGSAATGLSDLIADVRTHLSTQDSAEITRILTEAFAHLAEQQREGIAGQVRSLEAALATALSRHSEGAQEILQTSREGMKQLLENQSSILQAFSQLAFELREEIGPLFERLSSEGNGRGTQAAMRAWP